MQKNERTRTFVLGLGNMLMADDGVGLAALARLRDEWCLPHHVELVDGGTWGMNLLHIVEGADRLLIFDAISQGGAPGIGTEPLLCHAAHLEGHAELVHALTPA